jgi:hypothetical protein
VSPLKLKLTAISVNWSRRMHVTQEIRKESFDKRACMPMLGIRVLACACTFV